MKKMVENEICFVLQGIGVVMEKNAKPIALLNEAMLWQTKQRWQIAAALEIFTENRQKLIVS